MPIEKSAGAVIFRKEDDKPLFLLLRYPSITHRSDKEYWDFPKGHIEKGEKPEETAKRETKEETGLKNLEVIPDFKETIKYFFRWEGKNILKFVTFYLTRTNEKEVKISREHIGFEWLSYEKAMGRLVHKNAQKVLQKANNFLNDHFT